MSRSLMLVLALQAYPLQVPNTLPPAAQIRRAAEANAKVQEEKSRRESEAWVDQHWKRIEGVISERIIVSSNAGSVRTSLDFWSLIDAVEPRYKERPYYVPSYVPEVIIARIAAKGYKVDKLLAGSMTLVISWEDAK